MTVFTRGDPPRSRRHLHVFMTGVIILMAALPFVFLAVGCSPEQAIEGTSVFVNGLGLLVELHATAVVGSLGLGFIAVIGAVMLNRIRR